MSDVKIETLVEAIERMTAAAKQEHERRRLERQEAEGRAEWRHLLRRAVR